MNNALIMTNPDIQISIARRGFDLEAILITCSEMSSDSLSFLARKKDDGKHYDVLGAVKDERAKSDDALGGVVEEFKKKLNENQLRLALMKNNKGAREQMYYNALSNPVFFEETDREDKIPESIAKILEESSGENEESYLDDPLNIAAPWEEKNQ